MDHAEAIRIQATERYLLGELSEQDRDRFEEHYFECLDCAADVKAGAAVVDGARRALGEEGRMPAAAGRPRRWTMARLFWPMPAGAAAALALLALFGLHQAAVVMPRLRGELEQANALQPTSQHFLSVSRSAAPEIVVRRDERTATLVLSRVSQRTFPRYRCEVRDGDDRVRLDATIPAPSDGEIHLTLPVWRLSPGAHAIVIFGLDAGTGTEVARYPFTLRHGE